MTLEKLINKLELNKASIAREMNMTVSTFKNKLSSNQPRYEFTEKETEKLIVILRRKASEIYKAVGNQIEMDFITEQKASKQQPEKTTKKAVKKAKAKSVATTEEHFGGSLEDVVKAGIKQIKKALKKEPKKVVGSEQ